MSPPPEPSSRTRTHSSPHALTATRVRRAERNAPCRRPLFLSQVPAGFPSPADDYVKSSLDLSEHLVESEETTFYVRVAGDSMTEAGIHDGDLPVAPSVDTLDALRELPAWG